MAVGLDGRAFRDLPYPPGTAIFEMDRQEVRFVPAEGQPSSI